MKTSLTLTLSLTLLLSLSLFGQIPTAGLVAFWPFNSNANDESGSGHHGTVNGAVLTTDRFGNENRAYSFTNPNYISVVNDSSLISDELTLSWWFKVVNYAGQRGVLSNVGGNGGYQQAMDGPTFSYLIGYNFHGPTTHFTSNYTLTNSTENWQHVAVTFQKTGENTTLTQLYINGEFRQSDTPDGSIGTPGGETFHIGQNHGGINFTGELDDICIYNRVLSANEILALYTDLSTGLSEDTPLQSFVVSPNPSRGIVNIRLGAVYEKVQLQLTNLTGKTVHAEEFRNIREFSIRLNEHPGLYFLTLSYGETRKTCKLMLE